MEKFFNTVRGLGLKRGPQRWLGGVCGGIAAKLNVDVAFVRIAFLLLRLLPGPAFVFYLAAWLLLPDQRNAIVLETLPREALLPALSRPAAIRPYRAMTAHRRCPCLHGGGTSRCNRLCPAPHAPLDSR